MNFLRFVRVASVIIFYCVLHPVYGHNTWVRIVGGYRDPGVFGLGLVRTDDGYLVLGSVPTSNGGYSNSLLLRMNQAGTVESTKVFSPSPKVFWGFGLPIQNTNDGGYILLSQTKSLIKLDAAGTVQWHNRVGHGVVSVAETVNSGFIAAGNQKKEARVTRLDSNGNVLWEKGYKVCDNGTMVNQIIRANDGDFILLGHTSCSNQFDGLYIIKINPRGRVRWHKTYMDSDDFVDNVALGKTDDGGYILATQDLNTHIVKLDSHGNIEWQRTFDRPFNGEFLDIWQLSDNGYVFSDQAGEIIRMDPHGHIKWRKKLNLDLGFLLPVEDGFVGTGSVGDPSGIKTNMVVFKIDLQGKGAPCLGITDKTTSLEKESIVLRYNASVTSGDVAPSMFSIKTGSRKFSGTISECN